MNMCSQLKKLLNSGTTLVMPDAYDPISARIIEKSGFLAVQCSGGSYSISACYKSEADIMYQDNLQQTQKIVQAVKIPVMADGEDGSDDAKAMDKTIRDLLPGLQESTLRTKLSAEEALLVSLRKRL